MKIKGKITLLINREGTTIEVNDDEASIRFLEIKLTPEQLNSALARVGYTTCELEINGLDKIGKKHEHKTFEFEITKEMSGYAYNKEKLAAFSQKLLDKEGEGWISDGCFSSQNSFFKKDGKKYARVTARRWV